MKNKSKIIFFLLCLLLISVFVIHLFLGAVFIPIKDVFSILFGIEVENNSWVYIVERRFTRAGTSIIACSSLGISGLIMQTVFKNPLSGPSVLGITSGSSLGVAMVLLSMGSLFFKFPNIGHSMVFFASILGALITLFLVLITGSRVKNKTVILIAGIMFSYLTSAIVNIIVQQSEATNLKQFVFWGLGSFSHVNSIELFYFSIIAIICFLLIFLKIKFLNLSLMGEKYVKTLGINCIKNNRYLIILVGFLTGIVVSFCGPIAFVGIAVPHITKLIFKTNNHKNLIIYSILIASILGLLSSILSEFPFSIPINSIMSIFGAPIVIFVLLKNRKNWIN